MLVIAPQALKFLLRGRVLSVTTSGRYRKGRAYAVTTTGRRTAVCRAEILEILDDGVRVRLAAASDTPRLLAAHSQYGYTDNPGQAMHDEPEAISPADLDRLAQQAHARFAQHRADELAAEQARSIGIRVKEAARRYDTAAYRQLGVELTGLGG